MFKLLKDYTDGSKVSNIYLCRQKNVAVTKNGKTYFNVIVQDKSGTMDAKVWEPYGAGIDEFEAGDYVDITGDVVVYNGSLQMRINRARKAGEGEYYPENYVPVSDRDRDEMYQELAGFIDSIHNPHIKKLLQLFFIEDQEMKKAFMISSAAKSVHHGYVGGLAEHTLSIARTCDFIAGNYPVVNRDLLIAGALLHDVGKVRELTPFPANDYSDDGNLLGHIIMGIEMIDEKLGELPDFPHVLASELKHCILAHHGEYEFGSPKKPAIIEALALSFADNLDAKMETFKEALEGSEATDWMGFNRLLDSNLRKTEIK